MAKLTQILTQKIVGEESSELRLAAAHMLGQAEDVPVYIKRLAALQLKTQLNANPDHPNEELMLSMIYELDPRTDICVDPTAKSCS